MVRHGGYAGRFCQAALTSSGTAAAAVVRRVPDAAFLVRLDEAGGHELTAAVLRVHAARARLAARDRRMRDRLISAHPDVPQDGGGNTSLGDPSGCIGVRCD